VGAPGDFAYCDGGLGIVQWGVVWERSVRAWNDRLLGGRLLQGVVFGKWSFIVEEVCGMEVSNGVSYGVSVSAL
jgi:hypothetical protein